MGIQITIDVKYYFLAKHIITAAAILNDTDEDLAELDFDEIYEMLISLLNSKTLYFNIDEVDQAKKAFLDALESVANDT